MEKVRILKAVDIINDSVSEYEGVRPFLSTGDLNLSTITNLEFLTYLEKPSRANLNVSMGDIILARMQGTVKVKVIQNEDENIIVSTGFLVLRTKNNADNKYLFHLLKSSIFQNEKDKLCTGATQKAINNSNFEKLEIPLPNLTTQQKIAAILDQADAIIQNNRAIVQKYDALTQSLFLDMFGDPVKNDKGWEKKEVINYCSCIVPGRDKPKSFTGHIPWVTTDDLVHLGITSKSKKDIGLSEVEISNVKAKKIPAGSVIMTCVGKLGVISINEIEIIINQQLHAFQCFDQLNNVFLMHCLSFQKEFMYKMASSTTVPYMNKTICNSIPIILPPITLQNQFAERVALIEAQKQQAQLALAKSEELFQSLLQKAFKGEL